MTPYPKVILIGDAPLTGKTTLATELASAIGYDHVSTDDIGEAVRAIVEECSCTEFHPMRGLDYREYYISNSVDDLMRDALVFHRTLWPAVRAVAQSRLSWGRPAVIEGWAILPECTGDPQLKGAAAIWLIAAQDIFEARLRANPKFYSGASDEATLIRRFSKRSNAVNAHLSTETGRFCGCPVPVSELESTTELMEKVVFVLRTENATVIGE